MSVFGAKINHAKNWRSESVPWRNSSIMNNPSTVAFSPYLPGLKWSHSESLFICCKLIPWRSASHITTSPPSQLPSFPLNHLLVLPHRPPQHTNLLSWKMKSPFYLYLFLALHSFVITLSLQECCQATLGMQYPFFTGCLRFFAALIVLIESKENKPKAQTKNIPQKETMQAAGK